MAALAGNTVPPLGSPAANATRHSGHSVPSTARGTARSAPTSQGWSPHRRREPREEATLSAMFITVRYGDNCQEMVNLHCRLLILMAHLKRKCQCKPEDCIDLLDETGALMNLSKVENPESEFASKYLQERKCYILIRVIRKENSEVTSYESLLENLGKHYPDLPDRLQKLSARQSWRRGSFQRKGQTLSSTPARSRPTSPSRKSLRVPLDEDRT